MPRVFSAQQTGQLGTKNCSKLFANLKNKKIRVGDFIGQKLTGFGNWKHRYFFLAYDVLHVKEISYL